MSGSSSNNLFSIGGTSSGRILSIRKRTPTSPRKSPGKFSHRLGIFRTKECSPLAPTERALAVA